MRQMASLTDPQHALLRDWLETFIAQGVSQRELARVMNVSVSKLNRFLTKEQGRFYVPINALTSIAETYGRVLPEPVERYVRAVQAADTGAATSLASPAGRPPARPGAQGLVPLRTLVHGKAGETAIAEVAPLAGHAPEQQAAYLVGTNREADWLRAGWVIFVSTTAPLLPGGDGVVSAPDGRLRVVRLGADEDPPEGSRPIVGVTMGRY